MNFMKIMKYGAAAMQICAEASDALADGRLDVDEALSIVQTALIAADINGLDVSLISINERDDGGFSIEFPHEAVKDWSLDIDF